MNARHTDEPCSRIAALRALMGDDRKRREWLWLEAHMNNDETSIESLERADPTLPTRMLACTLEAEAIDDPRAREATYGRWLDARSPLRNTACGCPSCVPIDA